MVDYRHEPNRISNRQRTLDFLGNKPRTFFGR